MKAVIGFLVLLITFGIVYGLAFAGVIPLAKMAAKSPAAYKILVSMKLAKPMKPVKKVVAKAPTGPPQPSAEQQAVNAELALLQQEKANIAKQKTVVAKPPKPKFVPTSDKMVDIYNTMKPDDLRSLFANMGDLEVSDALSKMDEGKAGKVLAALPPARAASLTAIMNKMNAAPPATAMAGQPLQSAVASP